MADQARPGLVIFDCDGVLVDSEPISNAVLAAQLTTAGLPTTLRDAYALYKGQIMPEVIRIAEERLGHGLPEDFIDRFTEARNEAFRVRLKPIEGAHGTVSAVRDAGIPVCVASQGRLEKTEMTLKLTGLRALFAHDVIFSAYEVPRGKPFPDLFLHAAARMGVAPADAVVVEDTALGARGAVAAGMRVLGYTADTDAEALRAVGAETIGSLTEVPALIGVPSRS